MSVRFRRGRRRGSLNHHRCCDDAVRWLPSKWNLHAREAERAGWQLNQMNLLEKPSGWIRFNFSMRVFRSDRFYRTPGGESQRRIWDIQ